MCESEWILTPRITLAFGRAGDDIVPFRVSVLQSGSWVVDPDFDVAGSFGSGGSEPSSIWHFGLCDFDAANSHFEDCTWEGDESAVPSYLNEV